MKKNKMMRLASGLLVAVLITTSTISGTYAKYVTSGHAEDSARVAKFGVKIEATGVMFNDSYQDEATVYTANEEGDAITVQADTAGTDVVAPGTEGSLAAISVTGTPEVDTEVTYVAEFDLKGWEVAGGTYYCPLEITVGADTFKGTSYANAAAFEEAVEAAIVAKTAKYDTNTDLSAVNDDVQVSWKWAFEGNDDAKDTALGDKAAAGNAATVRLYIKTTITQVD